MAKSQFLECGKIINTHGCRGGIKLESYCNTPADLASLRRIFMKRGGEYSEMKITHSSVSGNFVLLTLEGLDDMDRAAALKNTLVYAAREDFDLSDGEYFIADAVGLDVIDADTGALLGKIREVDTSGVASDLFVVDTPNGERLLPAIPQFVKKIDFEKAVYVTPIEGLLD